MRYLRTVELGPFPLAALLSLIVLVPCAAVLQMVGEITSLGSAVALLTVGALGTYSLVALTSWAGVFAAELAIGLIGRAAASRSTLRADTEMPDSLAT